MPSKIVAACWRCGIRRQARTATNYLCGSCRPMVENRPTPKPNDALDQRGEWVRDGLIMRWQLKRRAPRYRSPEVLVPCGTHAAFHRHKRRGEEIDPECLAAERQYKADWMRQQRAQQRQKEAA